MHVIKYLLYLLSIFYGLLNKWDGNYVHTVAEKMPKKQENLASFQNFELLRKITCDICTRDPINYIYILNRKTLDNSLSDKVGESKIFFFEEINTL